MLEVHCAGAISALEDMHLLQRVIGVLENIGSCLIEAPLGSVSTVVALTESVER